MFTEYPYKNLTDLNLDFILKSMRELSHIIDTFVSLNTITFADPIIWDITTQYSPNTIVLNTSGNAYLSKVPVPAGVQLNNSDYWLEIFNFTEYTRTANQNLTVNVESNTTEATHTYNVDDWLIWNDVLYKVTSAIAVDDELTVDTNIVHFTVEDFIKAFMTWATNTINQYKDDIDASELAYRQQLAQDIATTTANLQAQLDAAIAGATVDSEVINARIGYDNTTYSTLHDAIVGQIQHVLDIAEMVSASYSDNNISLLNYFVIPKLPFTRYGVTINSITDIKKLNITGTSTASAPFNFLLFNDLAPFVPGKTYHVKYYSPSNMSLQIFADNVNLMSSYNYDNDINIPLGTTNVRVQITVLAGTTGSDCDFVIECVPDTAYVKSNVNNDIKMNSALPFYHYNKAVYNNLFNFADTTKQGLTFAWTNSNEQIIVTGTNATQLQWSNVLFNGMLPFESGRTYHIVFNSDTGFTLQILADNVAIMSTTATESDLTIPAGTTNLIIRLVSVGATAGTINLQIKSNFDDDIVEVINGASLIAALKHAYQYGKKHIYVHSGTYDVIEDYKNTFGSDYFDNYTSNYNGLVNGNFDYGLWLDKITIEFDPNALVICNYTGNNQNVRDYFSAISTGVNVKIVGLNLDAYGTRYAIHPDFFYGNDASYLHIKNAKIKYNKGVGLISNYIGAGMGQSTTFIIENTIFSDTPSGMPCLRIHNSARANAFGRIIIKNCYVDGDGYFVFNNYGDQTEITDVLVSGCSYKIAPSVGFESGAYTTINMNLYDCANEIRI